MPVRLLGATFLLSHLSKASCSISDETFYCSTLEREEVLCTVEGPRGLRRMRRARPGSVLPKQYLLLHWPSKEVNGISLKSKMCPLRYSVFNGIAELTDACIFGKLLIKTGPGPLQLVKQHGQYHYIFNRTLFPNELSDDTTYHPGEEFGSVLLTKLNPAPPPWHCHLNEYEYVSDDPLLIMYFRSRRVNELADCSVIDGSMHVSTDDERTMFMPPSTSAIVGKYDERIKAFNLTQSRGGSGYAFFVEGKNSNGKIDLTREAVLIVRWNNMGIILRQRKRKQQP